MTLRLEIRDRERHAPRRPARGIPHKDRRAGPTGRTAQRLTVRLTSALAIGAAAMAATAASAIADPLSITSSTPPDAAVIPPQSSFSSIPFTVETNVPGLSGGVVIELATRNVPGRDGTLADDFVIGRGYLRESDAYPGTYRGSVLVTQAMPAGNYFWQASGTIYQLTPPYGTIRYVSAPVALNVASPPPEEPPAPAPTPPPAPEPAPAPSPVEPPLQLTLREATSLVPRVIRRETRRSPIPGTLKTRCHRRSTTAFVCSPTWADRSFIYAGTLRILETPDSYRYAFRGLRARISCLTRRSVRACAMRVEW